MVPIQYMVALHTQLHVPSMLGIHHVDLHRHDFFIVETIEFFDEEDDDLPEPLSRKAVVRLARRMENAMLQQQEEEEEEAQMEPAVRHWSSGY